MKVQIVAEGQQVTLSGFHAEGVITIDWGDGTSEDISTDSDKLIHHVYDEIGTYTIRVESASAKLVNIVAASLSFTADDVDTWHPQSFRFTSNIADDHRWHMGSYVWADGQIEGDDD